MRLVESLNVAGLTPMADRRVGTTMMHMVQALGAAKRHAFLGHGDLVHVRRIHDGDRRDRFRFGRCSRMLLHARRQPFGQPAQQPADDEIDDRGHHQRLQNVEIHGAEST